MIENFKINPALTTLITYGVELEAPPTKMDRAEARRVLNKKYEIPADCILYLFNGTLDYKPNLDAVKNIIFKINPIFINRNSAYKIIICGKNLPDEMEGLKAHSHKNIIYAGFVEDVTLYFKGADVFLNPVTDGGGIKTKLVEALSYDLNVVSTQTGAIGVDPDLCNGKLLLTGDNDWLDFSNKMQESILIRNTIPAVYFDHFSWKNIALKAANLFT